MYKIPAKFAFFRVSGKWVHELPWIKRPTIWISHFPVHLISEVLVWSQCFAGGFSRVEFTSGIELLVCVFPARSFSAKKISHSAVRLNRNWIHHGAIGKTDSLKNATHLLFRLAAHMRESILPIALSFDAKTSFWYTSKTLKGFAVFQCKSSCRSFPRGRRRNDAGKVACNKTGALWCCGHKRET